MSQETVQQTYGAPEYASRWLRLGGAIIDGLIVMIPNAIILFALGLTTDGLTFIESIVSAVIGLLIYLAAHGYFIFKRAQTIGKMLLGIVVVKKDSMQPVPGKTYVGLRILPIWILTQIPIIGLVIGLVDALLIFRAEKNCLHDDIAGTRVIRWDDLAENPVT